MLALFCGLPTTLWKEDLRWCVLRKQISLQRICIFPSPFFFCFCYCVRPCYGAADYSSVPVFPLGTICWEVHVKTDPQPDAGGGEGTPSALHIHSYIRQTPTSFTSDTTILQCYFHTRLSTNPHQQMWEEEKNPRECGFALFPDSHCRER